MDKPALAVLFTLGFRCFLRTNEMLALQWNHLISTSDRLALNLVLPFSKTSNGNPQVLRIEDVATVRLVQQFRSVSDPRALLWPHTLQRFHRTWKQLISCLGFSAATYSPYGIRRGGATYFFLEYGNLDATVARGRWSNARTAKIYIDSGALALSEMDWNSRQKRRVRKWALKFKPWNTQLRRKSKIWKFWEVCFSDFWKICAKLENGRSLPSCGLGSLLLFKSGSLPRVFTLHVTGCFWPWLPTSVVSLCGFLIPWLYCL